MEADFERLLQLSPVICTTDLTNPVIQVEIEKQGRIMGQKTARLHVSFSNNWSAYPTGRSLLPGNLSDV